jgi:dynein heavy chain
MIDPQAQAIKWIKSMELSNNLRVLDLQTNNYLHLVEECIRTGRPCLCQNVKEDLDPSLDPVLTRAVKRIGGVDILKLGDREVEYNKDFRFYMTTKFAVKEQGLESQLLGIVVREEKPELEADKDRLVRGIAKGKKSLLELEDQLLRLLNETKGSLLENDELLTTLETSKQTAKTVQEQLITSEATEKDIDAAREVKLMNDKHIEFYFYLELSTLC